MSSTCDKVVVAMSGGVDSSVAACLLAEQGYEVVGLFMRHGAKESDEATEPRSHEGEGAEKSRNEKEAASSGQVATWDTAADETPRRLKPAARQEGRSHQGCCSAADAGDARFVAGMLGIPFYALNFEEEFDAIIDYFADEYARGRTPNPCVVCNDRLKFGKVLEYADAVGAKYIATGHYARVERRDGRNVLRRGVDGRKDQSYVLFGLTRDVLERVMFPIGHLEKSEVRAIAAKYNLPNRDKPDSVEICFVPDRDYARVVRERRPDAFVPGDVVDTAGQVIGQHQGLGHYTIGQRRGLGIAAGRPVYVASLDVEGNRVTLGDGDALQRSSLMAERVNWLIEAPPDPVRAAVKIRYLHDAAPATVRSLPGGSAQVTFDAPQRAITPGQAVVFYGGETCLDASLVLGGGWITC